MTVWQWRAYGNRCRWIGVRTRSDSTTGSKRARSNCRRFSRLVQDLERCARIVHECARVVQSCLDEPTAWNQRQLTQSHPEELVQRREAGHRSKHKRVTQVVRGRCGPTRNSRAGQQSHATWRANTAKKLDAADTRTDTLVAHVTCMCHTACCATEKERERESERQREKERDRKRERETEEREREKKREQY